MDHLLVIFITQCLACTLNALLISVRLTPTKLYDTKQYKFVKFMQLVLQKWAALKCRTLVTS